MNYGWRKLILFSFIVLLPALIVGISNFYVFPDSALSASIMLIVTVGVSGIFTYFSGDATAKIRRYCIIADVVICVILVVNVAGHWLLAREVSAAKQGVEEKHVEENREEQRRQAETERRLQVAEAEARVAEAEAKLARDQTRAANAERRRLAALPVEQRRSALKPSKVEAEPLPSASAVPVATPASAVAAPPAPRLTPDQVREKWWWFLTALAIAECVASVLGGAILAGIWEWDRDHDGVPDHLQQGRGVVVPARSAGFVTQVARDGSPKEQSDQE